MTDLPILGNGQGRCHACDGRGKRCQDPQTDHPTVVNPAGETVLAHHTKHSIWFVENPTPMVGMPDAPEELWTPGEN